MTAGLTTTNRPAGYRTTGETMSTSHPLLAVDDLVVDYPAPGFRKPPRRVISGASFALAAGETLALVGESGSGKSTIGKALLGLAPVTGGSVRLDGREISRLRRRQRRALSGDMQVVFQNPYGSLNPARTVGQILAEPLFAAGQLSRSDARRRIEELLDSVHMPVDSMSRYPSHFSGGQRQRIAIARALALEPRLIVCDEPTSALDVTTQAAVLELLQELQSRTGTSYLFITHDLAVVRHFAARVLVLEGGRIVEDGPTAEVCDQPAHPYTQRLVAAAPVPDPVLQRMRREQRLARISSTPDQELMCPQETH
ncbi:ABC transporter ATP-binding protein [Blastococcus saxobsidens]|uniref:ABC transporter ATP-binding protein n=1 Tax=Blastococcus saxobsidens (strain DD2) TaxID=1146883 RepID=H6RN68_BLASD|nr:ATP-binding cassette domain-containing protein [Blastococcus saxobsidens]CCG02616.1 ABC transporter ATP-binding protein [Blastococcus saxobsidens DD2]